MGKPSRDKGARRERGIVDLHKAMGVHAERVPLSGAAGGAFKGDVDIYANGKDEAPLVSEVKARANGEGFKKIEEWLADNDLLFLWRDRSQPLVVLPWRVWAAMVGRDE